MTPIFKYTLISDTQGSLVISEPIGWKQAKVVLERSDLFYSVVELFEGDFIFYGKIGLRNGGIDFLRQCITVDGKNAKVNIDVKVSYNYGIRYENLFYGKLDLSMKEEIVGGKSNKMKVPIIPIDLWTTFRNRLDTKVDVQSPFSKNGTAMDTLAEITIDLPTQIIDKVSRYNTPLNELAYTTYPMSTGGKIDASGAADNQEFYVNAAYGKTQSEIQESFEPLFSFEAGVINVVPPIEILDESGDLTIEYTGHIDLGFNGRTTTASVESDPSRVTSVQVQPVLFVQKNDDAPVSLDLGATDFSGGITNPGGTGAGPLMEFTFELDLEGSTTITVAPNDSVKVFIRFDVQYNIDVGADDNMLWHTRTFVLVAYDSDLKFSFKSEFIDTQATGFFQHDVFGSVIDRITDTTGKFYSPILGSEYTNYKQYGVTGTHAKYALIRGLHLRGYTLAEKQFFTTAKELWDGANNIYPLGLGMELVDGEQMLVIGDREYFYDKSGTSFDFTNIDLLVTKYDNDLIFKQIRIGYQNEKPEDIGGIDEPQTIRTYDSTVSSFGKDVDITSTHIAGTASFEITRRNTKLKSADYKFDDKTFILALNEQTVGSPETWTPELDENFTSITGITNPETRYNYRLSCARNFLRFLNWVSGGVADTIAAFKFGSGEGNYLMSTTLNDGSPEDNNGVALAENQDITISAVPTLLADTVDFNHYLSWRDYKTIRDNKNMAVGYSVSRSGPVSKAFIKRLAVGLATGKVEFNGWKAE